jgi:hypothetical protein
MKAKNDRAGYVPDRIQIAAVFTLKKPVADTENAELDSLAEDFAKDGLVVDEILASKGSKRAEFLVSWTLPDSFKGFTIVNLEARGRK